MSIKLTTVERRAKDYCDDIRRFSGATINVEWISSKIWGSNPRIMGYNGKCTNISGCGYDKLSACLASFLCFLFPMDSDEHHDIARTGGAGVSSVQEAMARNGWDLECVASGKTFDVFKVTKK